MQSSLAPAMRARTRSTASPLRSARLAYRNLARAQHTATRVDMVGPPDPTSNLRPVLYDQPVDRATAQPASSSTSPYSTSEFAGTEGSAASSSHFDASRIRKERMDSRNHHFWARTNMLFHAHLAHRLAALPASAPPEEIERVKTDFYRDWVQGNSGRMDDWVRGWWSDLARDLGDGVRRALRMR